MFNCNNYPAMLIFEGLTSLASAKEAGDKETSIEIAMKNIVKLKLCSKKAPENYSNKVILLEAELAVVRDERLKAKAYFKEAKPLSKKHSFIHEEAIACE